MTNPRRGFTLVELMIVVVLLPIVVAAVGSFYLEGRIATTRIEASVAVNRNLALTHEMIARDLRSADAVERGEAYEIITANGSVVYEVTASGLVREEANKRSVVSPRTTALDIVADDRGFTIVTHAERRLVSTRKIRFERTSYVARRR